MYLEKLSLHNYRGIRDMEIEFDRHLNVFVGDNGCGKSTIFDAIRKCLDGARLNHVAGTDRVSLEDDLLIPPHDINKRAISAFGELIFLRKRKRVAVNLSSEPGQIGSSLKDQFKRVDILGALIFPAGRDKVNASSYSFLIKEDFGGIQSEAFRWIKEQEDLENAQFRWHLDDGKSLESFVQNQDLKAVKKAVAQITGFSRITYNNKFMAFEIVKTAGSENVVFEMDRLSLGEQVFISLVTTIACEVVKYSNEDEDLLDSELLIIIDEIDLHLHPKWQRRIVPALRETFPNCQFIITTHSPQVLSEVPAENIFSLYRDENGDIQYEKPERSRGLSSSDILDEVMDLPQLPPKLEALTDKVYDLIEEEEFEKAKQILTDIENEYGEIPALIKARTYLKLSE